MAVATPAPCRAGLFEDTRITEVDVLIATWMPISQQETSAGSSSQAAGRDHPRETVICKAALFAILLAACCLGVPASLAEDSSSRHVVVISVDGMRASYYATPEPGERIPNLRRLMKEGSYAEAVEGIYPTITYPSHTTLVTGKLPAEHGIYTNLSSRAPGQHSRDWFWFAKDIKAPTLWDEARKARLTTASVAWPVTAGAAIDWDIPEIWDPAKGESQDPAYLAQFMNPMLAVEVLGALGPPTPGADMDLDRTRLAVYLEKAHKPNLLLVHLEMLDETQHRYGPASPPTLAELEKIDAHIGEILAAIKEAGLEKSTDVFVVSDHGFLPVERSISPNLLLVKAGLLTADAAGHVTGGQIDTISNGGSFFIYWPDSDDARFRPQVEEALKPLRDQGVLWAVMGRAGLKELGADPGAELGLEAADGFAFTTRASGDLVSASGGRTGTHGFLPFRNGLAPSFIAAGPGIRAGLDLHRIQMLSIAPTILRAMGVGDPSFGDAPPLQDVFNNR